MNLLQKIDNWLFNSGYDNPILKQALEQKAITQGGQILNPFHRALYQGLNNDLPVYMADDANAYVTKGYMTADVYALVNFTGNVAAGVPWKLYQKSGKDNWDVIQDHELLERIARPNKYQSWPELIKELTAYEMLTGNSYVYAPFLDNGLNSGKTTELHVLKAHMVQIISGGWKQPIKGYKYIMDTESKGKDIGPNDVLHFKNFNPYGYGGEDLYGSSPLKAAIKQVAVANDAATAQNAAFVNQGVKGIVHGTGDAWTEQQAVKVDESWKRKNGVQNTGKIVFTPGELGYIPLGLSPVDLNIIQGMLHNFRQLCNIFDGFPSVLLNDNENSTYNNLDAAHKAVYTNCVLPRLYRYRDGFNNWLTPRYGSDLWLDIDTSGIDVLQENKKELAETLEKAWWVKVVDKQKMMGVPEDPKMDFYMVPMNMVPMNDINDVIPPDTGVEEAVKALEAKGFKP